MSSGAQPQPPERRKAGSRRGATQKAASGLPNGGSEKAAIDTSNCPKAELSAVPGRKKKLPGDQNASNATKQKQRKQRPRAAANGLAGRNRRESEDAIFARLAAMPLREYDKVRKREAKRLGFSRISVFEGLVKQARRDQRMREARERATAAICNKRNDTANGDARSATANGAATRENGGGDAAPSQPSGFTISDTPESVGTPPVRPSRTPDENGTIYPEGFEMRESGLWYQPAEGSDVGAIWIAAPFEIVAQTNDETDHGHGLLLRWTSRTRQEHQWAMPQRMVHEDGNAIASELHDAGLPCGTSRAAHNELKNFMGSVRSIHRVGCVEHAGWHGTTYVLPNGLVFGAEDSCRLVLQSEHAGTAGSYVARGTVGDWQQQIARFAVGNNLFTFTMSAAFAGPLLDVMGETSGGIHLFGGSQTGKTTLLCTTASVCGPGDSKSGPIRSWRVTANGLEAVAAEHSDGLLPLDEIGQVSGREVGEIIYMLANQRGKARMNRAGGARRLLSWRLIFLSTGETTLAVKMGEVGLRPHAGQEVRLLNLSADAGAGLGVFQNLHGAASAGAFADQLRRAAVSYCGTALPAFLQAFVRDRVTDPERLQSALRKGRERFLASNMSDGADGQVRSAASRFALIGLAGELARAYGVVPWTEGDAIRAAEWCFRAWLVARGGAGAAEDKLALSMVAVFIAAHGSARFERLNEDGRIDPPEQRVVNRAGYVRGADGEQEFLVLASVWHEDVCKGIDASRAAKALHNAAFLEPGHDGRLTQRVHIPGRGRVRVYVICGAILSESAHELDGARLRRPNTSCNASSPR